MATYFGAHPYTAFSGINSEYYVSREQSYASREQATYAYDAPSASQTHSSISSPALSEGDPTPPREASPAGEGTVSTGYEHARPLVRQETLPPRFARKDRSFYEENVSQESAPVPSIFDMLVTAANAEVDSTQDVPPAMESASAAFDNSSPQESFYGAAADDHNVMVDHGNDLADNYSFHTHNDAIPYSYNNTPDTDVAMLSESDDEDADDNFAMVESEDDDEDEEYEEPARKRAKRSPAGKSGKKSPAGKKNTTLAKTPPAKKTPAKKDSSAKASPPAKKSPSAKSASPPAPSSASTRKGPPAKKSSPAKNTSTSTKKSPPKKTTSRSQKSTSATNSDADADPEMSYAEMVANIGSIKTLPWTTEGVKAFVTRFIKRSEARRAAVARKAAEAKQRKAEEAAEAAAKKEAEAAKKAAGEEVVEEEGKGKDGKGKKEQGKKSIAPTTTGKRKRGPIIEVIDEDNDLDEYEIDDDEDSDCHCHASSSSSSSSTSTPTTPCTCGPSSKKTCHALSQRIELLRTDPTLTSFGAHHAMCAGCGAQIRTDIRWEFYYKALWGKHSLEKCAGLRKWEECPPSAEQMEAWQKSRDASAEDAKLYFTMMADKGASDCVCKELGREVEIIRKYEADKAVRDAKKAQKEADAKEKKDVETEEPEDEDSEERAATPIPARPTRRLPRRAAARK
ncbi:hypothetical protein K525DRAFT_250454 [Schizophyllum commune Loenen D]|nr:hypothetical protein K525DRAFT_250454 [Schizophyllum commune Loenen D]